MGDFRFQVVDYPNVFKEVFDVPTSDPNKLGAEMRAASEDVISMFALLFSIKAIHVTTDTSSLGDAVNAPQIDGYIFLDLKVSKHWATFLLKDILPSGSSFKLKTKSVGVSEVDLSKPCYGYFVYDRLFSKDEEVMRAPMTVRDFLDSLVECRVGLSSEEEVGYANFCFKSNSDKVTKIPLPFEVTLDCMDIHDLNNEEALPSLPCIFCEVKGVLCALLTEAPKDIEDFCVSLELLLQGTVKFTSLKNILDRTTSKELRVKYIVFKSNPTNVETREYGKSVYSLLYETNNIKRVNGVKRITNEV